MPRTTRSAKLDSATRRKALTPGVYHQEPLPTFGYLRYRRAGLGTVGVWFVREPDPITGKLSQARLGEADDVNPADGDKVLDYGQAMKAAEARVAERTKAAKRVAGGDPKPGKLRTVRDVVDYYLAAARKERKSLKTAEDSTQAAEANILPDLGDLLVEELTTARLNKWHEDLAKRGRRKTGWKREEGEAITYLPLIPAKTAKGMTPAQLAEATEAALKRRKSSANRDLALLKSAFNLALTNRKIDADHVPWIQVRAFKGVKGQRVRFLSVTESQRLVNACPQDFRRLVQGALYTGARYSELAGARVADYDATGGTLRVDGKGKDTAIRHIFLTEEAEAFFKELTAGRAASELLFMRTGVERGTRADVRNAEGWLKDDQKTPMRLALKNAGLEPMTFHELRHTYASALVAKGVPLMVVAQQLGHADTRMVEEHYGHLAKNVTRDTIRTLAPTLGISGAPKVAELEIKQKA